MAIKQVVDHYKNIMKTQMSQIKKVSGLGDKVVLDLSLGGDEYVSAIRKGTQPIIVANFMTKEANSSEFWKEAVAEAIKEIKTTGKCRYVLKPWNNTIDKRGIYLVSDARRKNSILIRFLKDKTNIKVNDTSIQNLASEFRNIVYEKWVDIVEKNTTNLFKGQALSAKDKMAYKGGQKRVSMQMSQNTNISHQPGTTVAQLAIKELRKSRPTVSYPLDLEVLNVFEFAEQNMQISWGRTSKKQKAGKYTFDTKVNTKLEYNVKGSKLLADTKPMLEKFERATAEYIKTEIKNPNSVLYGITMEASKTIKSQIAEDSIHDIVRPLTKSGKPDKRFKINKKFSAKKFKPEKRQPKVVKQSKGVGNLSKTATLIAAGKIAKGRPQKRKREETDNLLKIEALINKRLPAEVRRNMGRPALINRSSRFSNSVEFQNVRKTKAGLSGEYTYLLSPYETFENTGSKRWPEGYNPKPLIAKSIRNLAIEYTAQKLVSLRRV
jgi:hypothetical protein